MESQGRVAPTTGRNEGTRWPRGVGRVHTDRKRGLFAGPFLPNQHLQNIFSAPGSHKLSSEGELMSPWAPTVLYWVATETPKPRSVGYGPSSPGAAGACVPGPQALGARAALKSVTLTRPGTCFIPPEIFAVSPG